MSQPTPRILPSHLHAFAPSNNATRPTTIRTLGTITSVHPNGSTVTLESCNRETVTLILSRDSHLGVGGVYEVIGKVVALDGVDTAAGTAGTGGGGDQGYGIKVLGVTEWKAPGTSGGGGVGIDMRVFEAVVDVTHRFSGLFYADGGGAGAGGEARMAY